MRRVSWASTRSWSRSRRFSTAARIAGSLISWKTIRRTGIFGLSVSSRCQAMASPSRSGSVASRTSSTDFTASLSSATLLFFSGVMT
jgi:hypothetical protein